MRGTRLWGVAAVAIVLIALAAACGGEEAAPPTTVPAEEAPPTESAPAEPTPTEEPAAKPGEGTTIAIGVGPWSGSAANANIAKILLERELGYTVELVELDEFAQFPALAAGDLDVTLEVWPSGHAEDYAKYIENPSGGVVDGGLLGVVGNIGWFVPTYLLDQYPELATWEGIKGNEQLFKTAESGDQGQLLLGDPSYVSYDEEIVKNLGLDLKVVVGGSEAALLTALDSAFANQDPLLLYFWSPHWALEKYDLTEVELPPFDEECAKAAEQGGAGYDCDYADDILYKTFSAALEEKAPEAFAFLSKLSYTNEDQQQITFLVDSEGQDWATAAQTWIDGHEDVWRTWLP
ncbi:MAG: glycine/betaine ABC transporter substrate-binding protein [Thermoleophilia bacterium]|nr:glycine/betaine ABC transporter substrate-binding protein [Thermoleophilia bacterium]